MSNDELKANTDEAYKGASGANPSSHLDKIKGEHVLSALTEMSLGGKEVSYKHNPAGTELRITEISSATN